MPWSVLPPADWKRPRSHFSREHTPGSCSDIVDAVIVQTSAILRRRGSEDVTAVGSLIASAPYCVPCLTLLTDLDARRVYAALERLKSDGKARLVSGICTRCRRSTTVHTGGE